jgi:GT2 family glycosyltransferase
VTVPMGALLATVIIPNYNGRKWLPRLMASLAEQTEPRFATSVVDDASQDDSVAYLRANWPAVEVVRNEHNRGFAATCNVGMQAAPTPFVVLLNNDTYVDRNWMAEGLRAFDSPRVGSAASLVLLASADTGVGRYAAEAPHLIDTAGDLYSVAGGAVKSGHGRPREFAATLGRDVFSASGASAFYRREAVAEAGWLDETFESYYEDVDLGFRLAWAGYRCAFAPASICYHHLSSSYDSHGWRYHYNSARNAEVVWWANIPGRLRRRHLPAHAVFLLLQGLNKLRQGCIVPYAAGKWAALRSAAEMRRKRAETARLSRAREAEIEALLVRDWWGLHVRSRLPRLGEAEAAE